MPLIRGHHSFDDHFAQIPNEWLRDDRVSLEARGLLAQIMSHRPGWQLSIKSIALSNHIGRDKVKRIIDELLTLGYLERSKKQHHDENGHLAGYIYTTRDPDGGVTQEPYKAKPYKAEPDKVSRPPKNTITKNTIDKKTISKKRALPDSWQPKESVYSDERYSVLDIDREVEAFRDWHLARGSRFADWDAAFRNWLKKGLDYRAKQDYRESDRERSKRELDAWVAEQMEKGEEE